MTGTSAPDHAAPPARLGILGGTFNPPHLGHLLIAQEACDQLGLTRVVFVPAAVPPHKEVATDPGAAARLAMVEAAIAHDARFTADDLEIRRGDRPTPSIRSAHCMRRTRVRS